MVKILVPTDFSPLSKVAIQYATKMSNKINGSVTLLHVITNVFEPLHSDLQERIKAVERDLVRAAESDFKLILEEAEKLNSTPNPVVAKIQKGKSFANSVKAFMKKSKSGLIVMGTRGASGLAKYVLGSNTVSILDISPLPVLAVPEKADFKTFKNVVYASDLKNLETELKMMCGYLRMFDSTLHVLHIAKKGADVEKIQNSIKATLKRVDYRKSTVTIQINSKIDSAIDSFVKQIRADLVTMFTHKKSAYDKLFNRSVTKRMAFQSKVPLLAFKST